MVKTVLVSDVHGNAPALRSVVEREGTDARYIFLGDLMGLCGYPKKVLSLVREVGDFVLAGNHDVSLFLYEQGHVNNKVLSQFEYDHTHAELTDDEKSWMNDLSSFEVTELDGQRVCMAHAFPWPERSEGFAKGNEGVTKRDLPSVASTVGDDYDYVLLGHTHVQYEEDCSRWGHDVHFVNPGCLGYNHSYAVIDFESGEVELTYVENTHDEVSRHLVNVMPDSAPHPDDWL